MDEASEEQPFPWDQIYDAHCHPTDTLAELQTIPTMRARMFLIMATRSEDQDLVVEATRAYGLDVAALSSSPPSLQHRVIPAFGWHPWFSYQMFFQSDHLDTAQLTPEQKTQHYKQVLTPTPNDDSDIDLHALPEPKPFEPFLHMLEARLTTFPLALLGEVGLDKSFRIPTAWATDQLQLRDTTLTPGGREGRRLTPYRVDMQHQRRILLAQLAVAGKHQRAASVHGVQAHGILYDTFAGLWKGHERTTVSKRQLKKQRSQRMIDNEQQDESTSQTLPFPPRMCLHSYSGPAETVKQYLAPRVPCDVYFSFSVTINTWTAGGTGKVETAVQAVPDDRLLIESDLHTAGADMDRYLRQAAEQVCKVKGWEINAGVAQLARNWKRFVTGRSD